MQNLIILFLILALSWSKSAYAQKGDNLYAAPGMPIMLARRPPARVAAKPMSVMEPLLSDPLPRFWKTRDSLARQQGTRQLWQAMRQRVRYPQTALRNQVEGSVQVRILITPDGAPLNVSILKTAFMPALADRKVSEELENEALRAAQLLRFQPKEGVVDTVIFPVIYLIQ